MYILFNYRRNLPKFLMIFKIFPGSVQYLTILGRRPKIAQNRKRESRFSRLKDLLLNILRKFSVNITSLIVVSLSNFFVLDLEISTDHLLSVRQWDEKNLSTWLEQTGISSESIRLFDTHKVTALQLLYFDHQDLKIRSPFLGFQISKMRYFVY